MKVLVTGGAGFIGSNLVRALLDRGDDVTVLDDLSWGYQQNLEPFGDRVRLVRGDILDPAAVADGIEGAEHVFHLAASVGNSRSIADPIRDAQINVIGTLRVLEAARAARIARVVLTSSAGT